MLKYVKNIIINNVNKEIDSIVSEFNKETAEACKLETEKEQVDNCLSDLREQNDCILNVVFWTIMAIFCGALGVGAGIGFAFRILMYIFLLISANKGFKYFRIRKVRKKLYKDLYKLSKEELHKLSEELVSKINKANELVEELTQRFWDKSAYLAEILKYDGIYTGVEKLITNKEPSLIEEFLDEKISCENIHFDHSLTNPIDFTEGSKHLSKSLV